MYKVVLLILSSFLIKTSIVSDNCNIAINNHRDFLNIIYSDFYKPYEVGNFLHTVA